MKVYVAMGGYDGEGCSTLSMRTFMTRESAEAWVELLTTDGIEDQYGSPPDIYYYGEVFEQEVSV